MASRCLLCLRDSERVYYFPRLLCILGRHWYRCFTLKYSTQKHHFATKGLNTKRIPKTFECSEEEQDDEDDDDDDKLIDVKKEKRKKRIGRRKIPRIPRIIGRDLASKY